MTKEKQIEEMAKILAKSDVCGDCTNCIHNSWCPDNSDATALYNAGYRKASEVAAEIFEEIEEILDRHSISYLKVGQICGEHYYDGVMQFDIAELKKKYTESEKDDG